jgi:regulator of sigma E protease
MLTIIVFILILGLLIFVHELGHFFTARRNGIKAEEFGFGFPPRILGLIKDKESKKFKIIWGSKEAKSPETIYSINWIPLGGFVKIKGEKGESWDANSFLAKSAWVRIKVLAAGVLMNFALAWVLIALVFTIGAPEQIDSREKDYPNAKVQIAYVVPDAPAEQMGLEVGDEILKDQMVKTPDGRTFKLSDIQAVQDYINSNKGREINLQIKRGNQTLNLKGVPRESSPEGQGPLGISMVETAIIGYPWYEAIWKGLVAVFDLTWTMLAGFFALIKNAVLGQRTEVDVAGPVGIAVLTKHVTALGLAYILQFAAILSINLGIINAFPFPALDGGRILFVVIEKIKGSPVSQKTEQFFHSLGFLLLILLMIYITFRDVLKFVK